MKRIFYLLSWLAGSLLLLSVSAYAKGKKDPEAERAIVKFEQDWANAYVKCDAAALDRIEADDYTYTGPDGKVSTKAEEQRDIKSGDLKITECKLMDLKVRIYGKTAMITGMSAVKGTQKQKDISGKYRFTDVLVRKKDKWQAVATHEVAITEGK